MADFNPPFSDAGENRLPTVSERNNGFPCGPADLTLFNALFNRIESELEEVIGFAGLTPNDSDFTQVRQAIEAIIAAAGGGLDPSLYLLMSQARTRLPHFPEIVSSDGKMVVTSPAAGTIRIPSGVTFMHRGVYPEVTVETDFTTAASKIYHVRWSFATGLYTMEDLDDVAYNPTLGPEDNADFDSTYDNMLIARVVTNSSDIPTITNLVNRDRIYFSTEAFSSDPPAEEGSWNLVYNNVQMLHELSRKPQIVDVRVVVGSTNGILPWSTQGRANFVNLQSQSRYGILFTAKTDFSAEFTGPFMTATYNAIA